MFLLIFTLILREMVQFDEYVSDGLNVVFFEWANFASSHVHSDMFKDSKKFCHVVVSYETETMSMHHTHNNMYIFLTYPANSKRICT